MYLEELRWETEHIVKVNCFPYEFLESGLVGKEVACRIGRIPHQALLGAWTVFLTQPCYEALDDIKVKLVSKAVIDIGLVRLPPRQWLKIGRGGSQVGDKKGDKL